MEALIEGDGCGSELCEEVGLGDGSAVDAPLVDFMVSDSVAFGFEFRILERVDCTVGAAAPHPQ